MTINKSKIIRDRLPKPVFRTIEDLDRVRNLMLGLHIRRKSRMIPVGYDISESNTIYLVPIEEELKLLVDAKHFLEKSSFNQVAEWLTAKSGRSITHEGLYKIMRDRRPDDRIKELTIDEREKI